MIKFHYFEDLTGKDRDLSCAYHGQHNLSLEGRIFSEKPDNKLEVGVSLRNMDIDSYQFDESTNSLDIFYDDQYINQPRAGLEFTRFEVPETITQINVYDKGKIASF